MSRRAWVRLDNASNIFLAARSDADPKVFRMSAESDHEIDPQRLQEALDEVYERYPLYHAVLRRGVFWYYLQDSDLHPLVEPDASPTCAPIYQADRRTLLFRMRYRGKRIILEIFHALSDGTGALWFLSDVVAAYARLCEPAADPGEDGVLQADLVTLPSPIPDMLPDRRPDVAAERTHDLVPDGFAQHFHGSRAGAQDAAEGGAEDNGAKDAPTVSRATRTGNDRRMHRLRRLGRDHRAGGNVHRVTGIRTPDHRTRAVELTMPSRAVLALARAEESSLTAYLTALFFESIRRASGGLGEARTLSASVPVNLRQFFPSASARNFFAAIRIAHSYGNGADALGEVSRSLERQIRAKVTPQSLEDQVRGFIRFERMAVLRIVPRVLKDAILRVINWRNNRGLSVAVSNLGRVVMPETAEADVRRLFFHVSAVRPQLCAVSHADLLTVSFTSPYVETAHIAEFTRLLTGSGIEVTVAAARVTEEELSEGER